MTTGNRGWLRSSRSQNVLRLALGALPIAIALLLLLTLTRDHHDAGQVAAAPPPDQQINITVTDGKFPSKILGGTCWQVFYAVEGPPQQNVPFDIVGDDTKVCAGATGPLFDKDPTPGVIKITITSALRVAHGDKWHVLQTQAPLKYALDLTKRVCDLSLGKCTISVSDFLKLATININVTDNVTSSLVPGQCAEIRSPDQATLIKKVCDGAVGDKDPGPGISTNVNFGSYSVDYQVSSAPPDRVPKQPIKAACTVANSPQSARVCKVPFFLNRPTPTPTSTATATNTATQTATQTATITPTRTATVVLQETGTPTPRATAPSLGGVADYPNTGGDGGNGGLMIGLMAVAALFATSGALLLALRRSGS